MWSIKILIKKTIQTIRESGFKIFLKKAVHYIYKSSKKEDNTESPEKMYMDVLFINGCYLPHPSRYRVSHQREQLLAYGVTSNEVFFENLTMDLLKRYRLFIFFRCPYTDLIGEFIAKAKTEHKTVLYDIDDLVIDKKYTDQIPYVQSMNEEEKAAYDEGVERMRKTLLLCDGAITTTKALADELKNYVPMVFVNRNVASDRMQQLSEWAVYDRDILPLKKEEEIEKHMKKNYKLAIEKNKEREGKIRLGYFSGSITHNDDIALILPVLKKIMQENKNVELYFLGELDIPNELKEFSNRIKSAGFIDWQLLPKEIASVDINLAPLCNTIFNAAKSENKWTEAALVKVPTIASDVGAMKEKIEDGITGLLCKNEQEWYESLSKLISDIQKRKELGENAYDKVKKSGVTIYTGFELSDFIKKQMKPNFVIVLPSLQTSGGVLVALKHLLVMKNAGYDVLVLNDGFEERNIKYLGKEISVISLKQTQIHARIDKAVGTLWSTVDFLHLYSNIKEKYYLVQNYETDFYLPGNFFRFRSNQSYMFDDITYITISKWCESWLTSNYRRNVTYIPNGIEIERFKSKKRNFNKEKIRILVEGNSDDYYKNVDESFRIVEKLPKDKFEIWYMSYQGKPKKWYHVDRFLHRIPYDNVPSIYLQCDILLKTSILESFSYPPLEMMATGGYVVVCPNQGNIEYLNDGKNCLMYSQGDINMAIKLIDRICLDREIQDTLYYGGITTAKGRDWIRIQNRIIDVYS